jgi:hypothetical protein
MLRGRDSGAGLSSIGPSPSPDDRSRRPSVSGVIRRRPGCYGDIRRRPGCYGDVALPGVGDGEILPPPLIATFLPSCLQPKSTPQTVNHKPQDLAPFSRRWSFYGFHRSSGLGAHRHLTTPMSSSDFSFGISVSCLKTEARSAKGIETTGWFTLFFRGYRLRHTDGSNPRSRLGKGSLSGVLSSVCRSSHDC